MKIPTIPTVESGLTRQSGAQPMNARLSGDALAAPGQALAQMGQTVTAVGLNWLDKELTMRRASEVAAAKKHLSRKAEEAAFALSAIPDAKKANDAFQLLMKQELQLLNAGGVDGISFSDRVAKRTFGTEASTIIGNQGLQLRKGARQLMAAEAVSSTLRDADDTARKLASATSEPQRQQLRTDLVKAFKGLVDIGHIDAKDQYKYEKQYLNKAAVLQVEQQLNAAVINKDEAGALTVLQNIQNPKMFKDLTANSRQDLAERATRLADSIERQNNSDEARQQAENSRKRNEDENTLYATTLTAIRKQRAAPPPDDIVDQIATGPKITGDFITKLLGDSKIRPEQHDKLLAALEQTGDPLVFDGNFANQIWKDLRNIANDEQGDKKIRIQKVLNKANDQVGIKISNQDFIAMDNRATQLLSNTPQAKQAQIYGKVIGQFADSNDILSTILPGAKNKAVLIESSFEALIADGVTPKKAFEDSISALLENEKINLRALPTFLFQVSEKPFNEWTNEDLDKQAEETNTKFKGKANTWVIQRLQIKMLRQYIENRNAATDAAESAKDNDTSSGSEYEDANK
jgi:hypothetical protein